MPKSRRVIVAATGVAAVAAAVFAYLHWRSRDYDANRVQLLSAMPTNGNVALFLDLSQLRTSPFLSPLFPLASQQTPDSDYAEFLEATGFNYERDLERVAISIDREPKTQTVFAIAEGHFDREKMESYGAQFGALKTADGRTLYAVPVDHSGRKVYFTFLRDDRVAWANDSSYFFQPASKAPLTDWREHFSRVAGTPVFVILRQDAGAASVLSEAPGGLRSPQLAALISQLEWISIGGKPQGNLLRVVVDGEAANENTVHQLKDVLSGLVLIAQMGLNDAKMRKQLDPDLREGYLELLNSADIQQLDRGTSKSVRVIFDVTPKLLQGATRNRSASTSGADARAR
jgi:hypothetical protein